MAPPKGREIPTPAGHLTSDEKRYIAPGIEYDGARPSDARLPSIADMSKLDNAELLQTLQHYGVVEPWESFHTRAAEYLARMTSYRPGSTAWATAMEQLVSTSSRRALIGLNRRIAQQWSSLEAVDGDVTKEMMWICEDDEDSCDECIPLGGEIKSYRDWREFGGPGDHCRGGDSCRCDLVVIE